ncbi:MAG: hypothetical protein ACSLEN_06345 [Candidatus Malihini olakiniferum]
MALFAIGLSVVRLVYWQLAHIRDGWNATLLFRVLRQAGCCKKLKIKVALSSASVCHSAE